MRSVQSNIKRNTKDFGEFGLFLTGIDVSLKNIDQFDPFRKGFARLFILRLPRFMELMDAAAAKRFKHLLEFGFTQINGISNPTLETESLTGGYTGGSFEIPSIAKDNTNEITIQLYEFSGLPIREFLDTWITGISDKLVGIGHYHGMISEDCQYKASNHVMEAVYVVTDPTGRPDCIEYSCLLSNMMPKTIPIDHVNYSSGDHGAAQIDIPFTCNKYESPQINEIAKTLLTKYVILTDSLGFHSGWTANQINNMPNYQFNAQYNMTDYGTLDGLTRS
jgi:hypothetical protein